MLSNKNLEKKPLDRIIDDLIKERNPIRMIKSYFRPNKYYINKKLLVSFKGDLTSEESKFKINSIYERLIYIIKDKKILFEIKIDTIISYFYSNRNDYLHNESRLYSFLSLFIGTFNDDILEIHKSLGNLKICLIELLGIIKNKLTEKFSLILVKYHISLLEIYFHLLKWGFASNQDFWKEFDVYKSIPKIYYPLELFQLKILYFKEVLDDNDKVKKLIFEFLNCYPKDLMRELNTRHYPDPIKFCKFLEKNLKSQILEIYLEYYREFNTNFIPPLFLKYNNLNNSTLLEIIIRNLNNTLFDYPDVKNYYEALSKHKPNRNVFDLYCEAIVSFSKQIFPFVIINIFNIKSLSLQEKFKIVVKYYSKYPETKWESFQPSFQIFLKNLNNERILRIYFCIIIESENFKDFLSFYKNLFIFNTKKLKKFGVVNYKKKNLKGIIELLNTPKFFLLKQLLDIFKSNFYNIYDDYLSIEEFVLKKFSFNSEKLKHFFYNYFSEIARYENDSKFVLKLYEEYNSFSSDYLNWSKDSLVSNKIISLIRLGDNEKLVEFLNRKILIETNCSKPNFRLLAFFEYLKGDYPNSKQFLEKEANLLEKYSKPRFNLSSVEKNIDLQEIIQEIHILIQIINFELNLNKRGSMNEVLKELIKIIKNSDPKKILIVFGYINSLDLHRHYCNISNFFNTIISFQKKDYETGKLYLDRFVKTPICKQWGDLYDLWVELLPPSDIAHKINDFSKRQYEIFESNPLFISTRDFLSSVFRKSSNLSLIFNYKDLIRKKYSNLTLQRIFWREVREFIKNIDRALIYKIGDSELEIQNKLIKILTSGFELVEALKRSEISNKHIDILINSIIPIEIKRIDNSSRIDQGWGQISMDFNIWNLNFGIELCIVEEYKKLQKQFLLRNFIIGNSENICIIIK